MTKHYDYIFAGSGCAGLSLLMRLINSGHLVNKTVLVIDKSSKTTNDRTWCFWEKKPGFFESVVHHSWNKLSIYGNDYAESHDIAPYQYKMIRAIDFYTHCLNKIHTNKNITILREEVLKTGNTGQSAFANTNSGTYTASYVFNSILPKHPLLNQIQPGPYNYTRSIDNQNTRNSTLTPGTTFDAQNPTYNSTHNSQLTTHNFSHATSPNQPLPGHSTNHFLSQHFKGFVINSPQAEFDPSSGTLMDFRISQQHGTSFVYVLPLSRHSALVEYTLFTADLLPQQEYDQAVNDYLRQVLKLTSYEVISTEFGVIPMTNMPFPPNDGRIINIGTAGGQTKPSSGYTFSFIQKQSDMIAARLAQDKFPLEKATFSDKKFLLYDSILLNVIATKKLPGDIIFTQLFRKNRITDVFRFLDNESTLIQDLMLIRSLPTGIFAKAALQQITKPPGSPVLHT